MKLSEKILKEINDDLAAMEELSGLGGERVLFDSMKHIEKVIKEICAGIEYKEPSKVSLKEANDFIAKIVNKGV